ncbi:protein transport protein Sec24C isoform X2 [Neocloeon triangulifer]|uniref:protein transport protein Sec24C isoform X2 n=1 Tax=Neocloeon triangulifer TaxID=2078957 RepID=UPI00286F6A77|nr:protein transport protein Sec24C isoform X2 [Neocloeon triangulifer]
MQPQYHQGVVPGAAPGHYPPPPGGYHPQQPYNPQQQMGMPPSGPGGPLKPPGPAQGPPGAAPMPQYHQPPFQNGMHPATSPAGPPNTQFPPRGPAPPQPQGQGQPPLTNQMAGLSLSGPPTQQHAMAPQMGQQPPWSPQGPPQQMGPPPPGAQPPPHVSQPPQPGMPPRPGMPPQQPYVNGSSAPPQMPPHGGMQPPPGHYQPPQGSMPPMPGAQPPSMGGMPPPGGMMPPKMGQPPMGPPGAHMASPSGPMPPPGQQMQPPPGAGMAGPQGYQQGQMPPRPGFPPQPQMDPYGRPMPQQPAYQQQPQQSKRLDPDQMPSPIQVMAEDEKAKGGIFYTNQRGAVPPLVTTSFVTVDQGNAGPRYIRSTMYNVPATIDMMKQTSIPFGLMISPFAEQAPEELPPPIVDFGEMGPVRCIRCKAYMSPLMQFVDGGRRFHCLLCKATSEVPAEYFQHLDHTGQRVDRLERPELSLGTYEYVATADYCRNNTFPKPPAIVFLIDVSYNNVKSGMVHLLCREMKNIIHNLPIDVGQEKSNMKVGFITYGSAVNFYNIKGTLAQPKMLSVGDVNDMFMPLLDGFLCEPGESEEIIDSLMEQIPTMFAESRETETILAPAIQAGLEALKASGCAGKLLVFHSSLPIAEAPGKLKNRDDRKLLGTEKEKTILCPQNTFYNNLGQECVLGGVSVDLFLLNNSYVDLATIGQVSRLTGGQIYKYTYFQADVDGPRLIADVTHNVSRHVAFDSIMRIRTSTGVRPTDFYGHYFMSNTTDMELAAIDSDRAVAIEVKHDDKLTEEEGVFIQVALLYTSVGGQRRLRILNLALKTCTQMADLYRSCDLDTIVNFLAKQAMFKILDNTPKAVKDNLVSRCAQMLACYRKNCASPSSAGQLILPECMKLLPLYANCLLKSDALSGGSDITIDDRSFNMAAVLTMDVLSSLAYFYPRLLPVHDLDPDQHTLPQPIRCSSDKLRDDGVFLLENGIVMFLWVGSAVSQEWTHNVFGDHHVAKVEIDPTSLPVFDNPTSKRLRQVIDLVRMQRPRSMKMAIVPQRDKLEMLVKRFLVEDRGVDGSASYVDFLCHMHKEIRNLLT